LSPETRVRKDHPLRAIRVMVGVDLRMLIRQPAANVQKKVRFADHLRANPR
jgi:hypothetical protein